MKWFHEIKSIEELRKQYKRLLVEHHPDNGGKVSDMQEINAEYDLLFERLKHATQEDDFSNFNNANSENEEFKDVLNQIISFNITIEIIGNWIWCFDCYLYREQLKALGFRWCSKKKSWMWHSGEYSRYYKTEIPLNSIRTKYGSEIIITKSKQPVLG